MNAINKKIQFINLYPETETFDYDKRIRLLRERKIAETAAKAKEGGADEDDYGLIVLPDEYRPELIPNHPDGSFYGYSGWTENYCKILSEHPLYVDPLNAFVGKNFVFLARLKGPTWNPDYPIDPETAELIDKYCIIPGLGADGHFTPNIKRGLEKGWPAILQELKDQRALHNEDHYEFYDSEITVVECILSFLHRVSDELRQLSMEERNPILKKNLAEMADCNLAIAQDAPHTLREAIQWMMWFSMFSRLYNRGPAGGQLDQLLLPYYKKDISEGIITDDDVTFYLACLFLQDSRYYQLSGRDPETGEDMTNHLSWLCLEGADRINVACNLAVRVHDKLPEDFFYKSVDYLFKNKNGWPRYAGDNALNNGFMRNGYPLSLARQRISAGCHWFCIPGREYTLNDVVKINTARVFEVAFDDMMATCTEPSVDLLWQSFIKHLQTGLQATVKGIQHHLRYQVYNEPELVCNLLMDGCIEKGVNITEGGVEMFNLCIDGCGIAVVADSFAALEQRIEREKKITWQEIRRHLQENFEGTDGEYIRQMLNHSERYGGGNTLGDSWGVKITKEFARQVKRFDRTNLGCKFIPGWFSWSNTIMFGQAVGATPNGRKAGEPINHGANPNGGFRKDGAVTSMFNTIASVQPGYGNTAPVQLEVDPGMIHDEESVWKMVHMIRALLESGNTLLNINIIDANKILDAHKDPTKYPDLVVRVTGFTAYFAMLSPEFRQLVVDRILSANARQINEEV